MIIFHLFLQIKQTEIFFFFYIQLSNKIDLMFILNKQYSYLSIFRFNNNQTNQQSSNELSTYIESFRKAMRFILVYKYGILQTKTQRIDVKQVQNTTELIEYLQKKVRQSSKNFIVTFKRTKITFRIIPGWSLNHYGLKEGAQIHIQLLEGENEKQSKQQMNINNRYLNNILGLNKTENAEMQEVKEEEQQQDQQDQNFNVRKYLDTECQKMLKEIQHKNLQGFLDVFQDYPENIQEEILLQLQKKKPFIIDQLGEKGWGALHYAIFCQATQIFDELIEMEVDVNKCTSDGWLPIQLAINLKNTHYIQKLLEQQSINLNLVTSRGSPLHTAAKLGNKQILEMILQKDIDSNIKDTYGKTALDICQDPACGQMIKKYEEKKQTYNQYIKGNLPLSLTTIVRGQILKVKRPFMNLKERYLLVDPFQGSLIRYQNKAEYPKKPKQITPLSCLKDIHILQEEQKSWHMKKELVYFVIEQPNKQTYACKFRKTATKWVSNLKLAVKFAQQLQKNPQLISQIKRNELIIQDIEQQIQTAPKKIKKNIFNMSIGSRNSTVSRNSHNSVYDRNANSTPVTTVNSNNANQQNSANSKNISSQHQQAKSQRPHQNNRNEDTQNNKNDKNLVETRDEESSSSKKAMKKEQLTNQLNQITNNSKVTFSSFDILSTLGSGAFGKVFLAKHIATGNLYALKALKKKNLILQKQLKYAIIQANILKQANHPFIVNLHFAFQTPHYLYLALDYCPGRDLSFHLARQVTFPQDQARFYIAQLILAIEHLHLKKIIYRDLKPENVLLDDKGHIRLADFGLSKQTQDQKTKSFCGSPAYLSPEMLNQKGAGKESDLYGIGAVLYEFLIGEPPYFSDDIPTLYRNIKQGKLKFPKNVSEVAKNLISGLLQRDPKKRLGAKSMSEIKTHPFFASIDWQKLVNKQIKPPIRPEIQDSQNSDEDEIILSNKKGTNFTDFDYDQTTKKINRLMNFSFARTQ